MTVSSLIFNFIVVLNAPITLCLLSLVLGRSELKIMFYFYYHIYSLFSLTTDEERVVQLSHYTPYFNQVIKLLIFIEGSAITAQRPN